MATGKGIEPVFLGYTSQEFLLTGIHPALKTPPKDYERLAMAGIDHSSLDSRYIALAFTSTRLVGSKLQAVLTNAIPKPNEVTERQTISGTVADFDEVEKVTNLSARLQRMHRHPPIVGPDWDIWNYHDRASFSKALLTTDLEDRDKLFDQSMAELITKKRAIADLGKMLNNAAERERLRSSFWHQLQAFYTDRIQTWGEPPDFMHTQPKTAAEYRQLASEVPDYEKSLLLDKGLLWDYRSVIDPQRKPGRIYRGPNYPVTVDHIAQDFVTLTIDESWRAVQVKDNGKHKVIGTHLEWYPKNALSPVAIIKENKTTGEVDLVYNPDDIPADLFRSGIFSLVKANLRLGILVIAGLEPSIRDGIDNPIVRSYNGRPFSRNIVEAQTVTEIPRHSALFARGRFVQAALANAKTSSF